MKRLIIVRSFLCGDKTIYDVNFECIQDEIYVLAVGILGDWLG